MNQVFPGRFTARAPSDATAVFLIGLRINTLRGLTQARPALTAMPRMLKYLMQHEESGLLSFGNWFSRTTMLVSYWRSAADVQRFAADPEAPHAPAWREFNARIGAGKDIGVWHELYTVTPGNFEGVYVNMPAFGMAAAGEHLPVGAGMRTSKQRMAAPLS